MIVAVLSDVHGNLPALEAVLGSLGSVDAIWHLGDVVGYGAEPDGVVERLRELGAIGVKGNHDDAACGGSSIEDFNPAARTAAEWTRNRITAQTRRTLDSLPTTATPDAAFTIVHGSPRDPIVEYVFSPDVAASNLHAFDTPYCLVGHTHEPLVFRELTGPLAHPRSHRMQMLYPDPGATLHLDERRALLNPGSVGQPRDGNPEASYLILDTVASTAAWHRVAYDIEAAKRRIVAAGLPRQLASRLDFGQ